MKVPVVLTGELEDSDFLSDDFFGEDFDEEEEEKEGEGELEVDPSVKWYGPQYCDVVTSMPSACLERSLLELWATVRISTTILPTMLPPCLLPCPPAATTPCSPPCSSP